MTTQDTSPAAEAQDFHSQDLLAAAKDLREAARLIRRSRRPLNTRTNQCESCGVAHYEAVTELRASKALEGLADSADKWARRLEDPTFAAPEEEVEQ